MDPIDPYDEMDEEIRKAFAAKDAKIKELEGADAMMKARAALSK